MDTVYIKMFLKLSTIIDPSATKGTIRNMGATRTVNIELVINTKLPKNPFPQFCENKHGKHD